jgi:dihydrofolate reductase
MRRVIYSVATSLDGYIAGPNGEADWIVMDPELDFRAMFARFDTVLIGRKTYEAAQARGGGGGMPGMQAYVFSRTLKAPKRKTKSKQGPIFVSDDAKKVLTALKKERGKDIWLMGGGDLFRSLLALGLVDVVQVGMIPVLLGAGIPLLPAPADTARLKLTTSRVYQRTGTVMLEYAVR